MLRPRFLSAAVYKGTALLSVLCTMTFEHIQSCAHTQHCCRLWTIMHTVSSSSPRRFPYWIETTVAKGSCWLSIFTIGFGASSTFCAPSRSTSVDKAALNTNFSFLATRPMRCERQVSSLQRSQYLTIGLFAKCGCCRGSEYLASLHYTLHQCNHA